MKEIIEKNLKHKSIILVTFVFATTNLIIYLAMNIGEQRKIVYSTISLIYVMTIIGLTIFKCKNISSIDDAFIHLNFFLNIIIIIFYFCSILLLIVSNVYDKTINFDFIQIMFISSVYIHLVSTLVLLINLSFKIFNIVSELMKEKEIKREEEEQQKKETKMMKIDIDI